MTSRGCAIRMSGLSAGWGTSVALSALELELDVGEVLCVLGPGGSGKSTLLKLITELVSPPVTASTAAPSARSTRLWWRGDVRVRVNACAHLPQPGRSELSSKYRRFVTSTGQRSPLLLLDEPLDGLPHAWIDAGAELLRQRQVGQTVVLVTHYLPLARALADRVLLLVDGELIEAGRAAQFFAQPQRERTAQFLKWGA